MEATTYYSFVLLNTKVECNFGIYKLPEGKIIWKSWNNKTII